MNNRFVRVRVSSWSASLQYSTFHCGHFTFGQVKLIMSFGKLVIDWSVHTVTCWWCWQWCERV